MTTRLAILIVAVADLARSVRFYRQALDATQTVGTPVYAEFELPAGPRLGLYQREGFGRNTGHVPLAVPEGELTGTELYFYADHLPDAIRRLESAGGRLLSPLSARGWGDDAAYYADPDGIVIVVARSGHEPV